MLAYEEELFGPVATIIPVDDEQEALRVANDNIYGLGGGIFSADTAKAQQLVHKELQAGCCFVNSYVKSDPRLPFGGIKESGYGRDYLLLEFVNLLTSKLSMFSEKIQ